MASHRRHPDAQVDVDISKNRRVQSKLWPTYGFCLATHCNVAVDSYRLLVAYTGEGLFIYFLHVLWLSPVALWRSTAVASLVAGPVS